MPEVSIIIRTKNEERWISSCLQSIYKQNYKNFEVILVDNNSTDRTVDKAKKSNVKKIINISEYFPGKAINLGIEQSEAKYVVILSAHCLPVDNNWLSNLIKALEKDKKTAGVYGRQEPMNFSSSADKRDLNLIFGLDEKVQNKDSFFHNANSIIRKKNWEIKKFDETKSNIEDRIWAKSMQDLGYNIRYEPAASVYHYHGIHQNNNEQRLNNVVKIIDDIAYDFKEGKLDANQLEIVAVIPIRGTLKKIKNNYLLAYTIKSAFESKYIDKIIVSTDNLDTAEIAKKLGAECPFIRPEKLSNPLINLEKVQEYSLKQLELNGYFPDLVFHLEETFPFRDTEMLDKMITQLLYSGYDSVLAAKPETGCLWTEQKGGKIKRIDQGYIPREFKELSYVGIHGLGVITYSEYIRKGSLLGQNIGLYKIKNLINSFEVREENSFDIASKLLK